MAEEDNFDIDIYGDLGEDSAAPKADTMSFDPPKASPPPAEEVPMDDMKPEDVNGQEMNVEETPSQQDTPLAEAQVLKRKEPSEDAGIVGTAALQLTDLNWWNTDDDVRGWINQAGVEPELKELTFNEHKVNGKSKGQVFVGFNTVAASVAVKAKIEEWNLTAPGGRKIIVNFTNPHLNIFKTPPKDVPARGGAQPYRSGSQTTQSSYSSQGSNSYNNFRGRGGFNRGGNTGYQNRNSYTPAAPQPSYGGNIGGMGYQAPGMGAVGNMANMNQGFGMRGGMMNMRGRGNMMGMAMNPMAAMGGMNMQQMNMGRGFGQPMVAGFQNPVMGESE